MFLSGALVALFALGAAAAEPPDAGRDGPEVFGVDTPLGRFDYRAGRGLRAGDTGFWIGGFATAELERLEGESAGGGIEGINVFLVYDPVPFLHFFSEVETSGWPRWEEGEHGVRSDPGVEIDRLHVDATANDRLGVRFGKFLTPIGRWNLAPAEPLVWTTSEPLLVEEVFDETVSGAMLRGAVFPRGGALSYSIYGTFLDPIAPDREDPPAEHAAGARLEWTALGGWSVGASYFASEASEDGWNHLGGADFLWRPLERLELSAETLFGEATRAEGGLFGFFAQAVVETLPTLYAVGRYERFEPPGDDRRIDLFDAGLAWVPVPWLRLKADYRFADHFDDLAAPGFRSSFSVLF